MALFRYSATSNKLVPITSEGNIGLPVGAVMAFAQGTSNENWLLCDGRDTTGTAEELRTKYPALYTYLGNTNVLPDYRECVLVGVGENTTDTIAAHDVYTLGEFKDDQFQGHRHQLDHMYSNDGAGSNGGLIGNGIRNSSRTIYADVISAQTSEDYGTPRVGTTTHGKQKGVAFYIKATSAGIEVDKDLYATKGYIREQNILSEWEAITLPTTAATAITMEYDGFLFITAGVVSSAKRIFINGVSFDIGISFNISGETVISNYIPFKKGDVIYVPSSLYNSKVAYYKLRDYTGR